MTGIGVIAEQRESGRLGRDLEKDEKTVRVENFQPLQSTVQLMRIFVSRQGSETQTGRGV